MSSAAAPDMVLVNGAHSGTVSALERGLHYGDGLFETLGCVAGRPRFLTLHLARLARGCARLKLAPPDLAVIAQELEALAGGTDRAILKLILTRGPAVARGYAPADTEHPTRVALRYLWPLPQEEPAAVRVRIAQIALAENPVTAGIKHLNRLEQVLARAEWHDPAIAEALLFSRSGALISGTMSNVFLVRNGTLMTPSLALCGVEGVMRQVVLDAAGGCTIETQVRELQRADLEAAEEIFLTNALWGIRAVAEIAGRRLGAATVTGRLKTAIAPLLSGGARAAGAP
ncbi:MAG TPA: aminodeoxychorismate lyase [Steroidobacteraceae bacterium]